MVKVLDLVVDGGRAGIVTELVPGRDRRERDRQDTPLPDTPAADLTPRGPRRLRRT